MTLFHRANLNSNFSFKNSCLKSACVFNQLLNHGKSVHNVPNEPTDSDVNKKDTTVIRNSKETKKYDSFKAMLDAKRKQAKNSIIVQVTSIKSIGNLHKECSVYGNILNMHHYRATKDSDFVLLEFEDSSAVDNMNSEAHFSRVTQCIPVVSSIFKFKPIQVFQKPEAIDDILFVQNGTKKPTLNEVFTNLKAQNSVSNQMVVLHEMLKLNDLGIRLRFHTAHQLEKLFNAFFANAAIYPFGSTVNGFGKSDCDLDAVMILDNQPFNQYNKFLFQAKPFKSDFKSQLRDILEIIASCMHHLIPGIHNVRRILNASVPIIKFNQKFTNVECDLSISNSSAIHMSELLYIYGEMDSRVKPLVATIRFWAQVQHLTNNAPGPWITNFSLTILVLFFLQKVGILPSVDTLKSHASASDVQFTNNGADCTFLRDINTIKSQFNSVETTTHSLQDLLYDFFDFYSKFDYSNKGISIRNGVPLQKSNGFPLYIYNPLDTQLNVSKNVQASELSRLIVMMRETCRTLEKNLQKHNQRDMWGILSIIDTNLSSSRIEKAGINVQNIFNTSNVTKQHFPKKDNPQLQVILQNMKKKGAVRR